jgi:hypothetical protein
VPYSPEEASELAKDVVGGYRLASSWPVSLGYLRDMPISGETKEYHKTRALLRGKDCSFVWSGPLVGAGKKSSTWTLGDGIHHDDDEDGLQG